MERQESIEKNAVVFVNLLTPGNFEIAKQWLSNSCEYKYQGNILTGNDIIKSFSENHDNAASKISIDYIDGKVKKVDGQTVFVEVQDQLGVGDKSHLYEDCLAITCNDRIDEGSIEKIEHYQYKKSERN